MRSLTVWRADSLVTVQDLGRIGFAHLGAPRGGALDEPALRLANRVVGNPECAAGLEITLGGFAARLSAAGTVALTGAVAPLRVNGRPAALGAAVSVPAGALVEVGACVRGVRAYLAIDGGIALEPVLGSRSTDTLAWLGPPPVRPDAVLPLGPPTEPSTVDCVPVTSPGGRIAVRVRFGPRAGWFAEPGRLCDGQYQIGSLSNRIGVRLDGGKPLRRAVHGELPSEGIVLGAVQVPTDGQPLVFLADHPTTGGYPVIAVVERADLPAFAQARPGDTVTFRGLEQ